MPPTTETETREGHVSTDEIQERYPNVLAHLQASLNLTEQEALSALRGHLGYGGAAGAVVAMGGGTTCLRIALRPWRRELNRQRGAV